MIPREVVVSSSSLHPGGPQYRSRHPVETGAEARGMEAPPRGGGADLERARHKWICLRLERRLTVHSGSPSCIQLLPDWTQWCRRGRGFVCMLLPRSLCSWESWREFTGTGFYYFSLPRGGHEVYGSVRRDLLSQAGGLIFHPHPELWKLWVGLWGGPAHGLNRGCWDHSTFQSPFILHFRMRTRKGIICFAQCGH